MKKFSHWFDFHRSCPNCNSHIPRYKRVCSACGTTVKNVHGKVYIAR